MGNLCGRGYHVSASDDDITLDLFRRGDWRSAVRVRQVQARYEEVMAAAERNGRHVTQEMVARGYRGWKEFQKECPLFPLFCWPSEFAELGAGTVLYFHFLTLLGLIFLAIFILQTPCMAAYGRVDWMSGWQWNEYHAAYSTADPCRCIGQNRGITGLDQMGPQSEYGLWCKPWDSHKVTGVTCEKGQPCPIKQPGRWQCRAWCFADASCPTPLDKDSPSRSNVHFQGMVRAYSACSAIDDRPPPPPGHGDGQKLQTEAEVDAWCSGYAYAGDDIRFNEKGVDLGDPTWGIGSKWLTPGNFGPFQADNVLVPTLYFVCICVMCFFILVGYQSMVVTEQKVDSDATSPNDYALLVHGMPRTATDEQAIMHWFEENSVKGQDKTEIVKVVIGWDVLGVRQNLRELGKLQEQIKKMAPDDPRVKEVQQKMKGIVDVLNSVSPDRASKLLGSSVVVVVFRYQKDMRACLERWTGFWAHWFHCDWEDLSWFGAKNGLLKGQRLPLFPTGTTPTHRLQMMRAPNPGDINWEELGHESWVRYKKIILSNCVMLVVIGATFGITYGLNKLQTLTKGEAENRKGDDRYGFQALALIPAVGVGVMNALLQVLARKLGKWEYHETKTEEEFAQAMKMSWGMILNTAGVLLFLNAKPIDFYKQNGLVSCATSMLLINAIVPPVMPLFQINYWLREWERVRLTQGQIDKWNDTIRRAKADPANEQCKKELEAAGKAIENWKDCFGPDELDDPRRFADALKVFFCCLFFSPVIPYCSLLGCVAMFLQYWVDKYMLLRVYRRPSMPHNSSMARFSLRFIKYIAPAALTLAVFIFLMPSWGAKRQVTSFFVLSIIVGGGFSFVLPLRIWAKLILRCCHKELGGDEPDFYKAQYMWSTEMRYHKDHFIYKKLPETVNPTHFKLGTSAAVKVSDVKASYGVAVEQAADEVVQRGGGRKATGQLGLRGGRKMAGESAEAGAPTAGPPTGPAPVALGVPTMDYAFAPVAVAPYTAATPLAPAVQPPPVTVPNPPPRPRWEFEAHGTFRPFAADCQDYIERKYTEFQAGRAPRVKVSTSGIELSIDFSKMTQMKMDTRKVANIRRLPSCSE